MIFEQAFFHLPEVLLGSGYLKQEYEAGIVGAFSLAILQVLNGRNAFNPLGYLQYERLYRQEGQFNESTRRYLRADLYVNIENLFVANRRLAQYGWRHYLWLEAKFLRGETVRPNGESKHAPNKTAYTANFLADLIRLAVLVPETGGDLSSNGRYFLHVYDNEPRWYLAYRRRPWLKAIHGPGRQSVILSRLDQERSSVIARLGELPELHIEMEIVNFVIEPSVTVHTPCYWMYLTRIDAIKVIWAENQENRREFRLEMNRRVVGAEHLQYIASIVASRLHLAPDSFEESPPEVSEFEEASS